MEIIRVAIIEDDREYGRYLQSEINSQKNFDCTYFFETAEEAMGVIPTLDLDVVLTDIGLPGDSGIEAILKLKPQCPQTEFLMLSAMDDYHHVFEALKAGATGYMVKTDSIQQILTAIEQIHQGGSPMSSQIARMVVNHFSREKENKNLEKLSPREREILELLSGGYRYKEIGDRIYISDATVRTHVRNIYKKLQVGSRTEALNKIYRRRDSLN